LRLTAYLSWPNRIHGCHASLRYKCDILGMCA
jgi:hypothetical protein